MKALSKIFPSFMGPSTVYDGLRRQEHSCEGCPLRQTITPPGVIEHKCRITGEYEVPASPSSCPLPCIPKMAKVSAESERVVCPQGSTIIDLRMIHWKNRQEVAQRDLDNGCIPAQALKRGEIVALDGFRVVCTSLEKCGSKWARFSIEWEELKGEDYVHAQ